MCCGVAARALDEPTARLKRNTAVNKCVKKLTIMGDHDANAAKASKCLLKRLTRVAIKMVGGLIEDEHIGTPPQAQAIWSFLRSPNESSSKRQGMSSSRLKAVRSRRASVP